MLNSTSKIVLGVLFSSFSLFRSAQCPAIDCPADIVSDNDSSMCDANVTFSMPTASDSCGPVGAQTFSYTGAQQTFTVPPGVTNITIDASGAQGGSL
jgi:hypothetical protein